MLHVRGLVDDAEVAWFQRRRLRRRRAVQVLEHVAGTGVSALPHERFGGDVAGGQRRVVRGERVGRALKFDARDRGGRHQGCVIRVRRIDDRPRDHVVGAAVPEEHLVAGQPCYRVDFLIERQLAGEARQLIGRNLAVATHAAAQRVAE
jgi:hypothetical protein